MLSEAKARYPLCSAGTAAGRQDRGNNIEMKFTSSSAVCITDIKSFTGCTEVLLRKV